MARIGSSERPDWPLAVVVGAGGLGMAVARRLGQSHRLLLADCDADHTDQACAKLRDEGHDAKPAPCDVTRREDVTRLIDQAAGAGPVRTLAQVVGLSIAAQDFHAIVEVNLVGAAAVAAAAREIIAPGGCGVFISSSSAHMGAVPDELLPLIDDPLQAGFTSLLAERLGAEATAANAYMFSKIGLNRMCVRSAGAWGERGLRIVSLSPGLIATPMGAAAYEHSPGKRRLFDAVPLGRECSMLEIAGVIEFLASDRASFISGTDILVDGGMIANLRSRAAN